MRGLSKVHKKLLIQAAGCNLALWMRILYGGDKPRRLMTAGASSLLRFCRIPYSWLSAGQMTRR